jgi:predicted DNA-binding transcriptional regulator AlpA
MAEQAPPRGRLITSNEFADKAGVKLDTLRKYHKESQQRRQQGPEFVRPSDVPPPYDILAGRLRWDEAVVDEYLRARNERSA